MEADVYLRNGYIYLHSRTNGGTVMAPPFIKLPDDAGAAEILGALREALAGSLVESPWPTDWKAVGRPFQELTGVRSWKVFALTAQNCAVLQRGKKLIFRHSMRDDSNGSYAASEYPDLTISADESPEKIVEALKICLSRCESL